VPGGVANYAADAVASTTVAAQYLIAVRQTARLDLKGGSLDSDAAGPGMSTDEAAFAVLVTDEALLWLHDFTLGVAVRAIHIVGGAAAIINNATIVARHVKGHKAYGLLLDGTASVGVQLNNGTTLRGFKQWTEVPYQGGVGNGAIAINAGTPTVQLNSATLTESAVGIVTAAQANPTLYLL